MPYKKRKTGPARCVGQVIKWPNSLGMNEKQKPEPKLSTSELGATSKFHNHVSGTMGNNDYDIKMGITPLLSWVYHTT